jgi:hypothetical protein
MAKKLTVASLIMLIGGAVTLLFSFLDFYKVGDEGRNAWSSDGGAFATTVPALLGLAMVVWIILELTGTKLPAQVLTFNANQLKATWGISAGGLMLSWFATDFGGLDKGIGFWMMLLGSLAMAVGAVLALLGMGNQVVGAGSATASAPGTGAPPPPPGFGQTPPGGMPPPPPPG